MLGDEFDVMGVVRKRERKKERKKERACDKAEGSVLDARFSLIR